MKNVNMKGMTLLVIISGLNLFACQGGAKEPAHNHEIKNKEVEVLPEQKSMPEFEFTTLDDQAFTNANLDAGKPVLLLFYNTGCPYCQAEIKEIKSNIALFEGSQIVMISWQEAEAVNKFITEFEMDKFPQVKMVRDTKNEFFNKFKAESVPAMFIYNKDRKLVKEYIGQTDIKLIHKALAS